LFALTLVTPASARLFSFLFEDNTLDPDQYSVREDRVNAYNQQAIELFEEGHFEEAQELWEKAIEVMERSEPSDDQYYELKDMYDPVEDDVIFPVVEKKLSDVDEMYNEAIDLFRKQRYVASKKLFERVESRIPDHKATRNYLSILEHKIKQTQQTLSGDSLSDNVYSRQAEREEWNRILKESERQLERKIEKQVEPLYEEALVHYKERRFKLAKDFFLEVDTIKPGYKDTTKYLARVDADLKEEEQLRVKEEYRNRVLARKQEHEEWQRIIAESEKKLQDQLDAQADPIYEEALYYYKQREFELAKAHFEEVKMIVPDFKSVNKYLGRIDEDIQKEIFERQQEEARELARQQKEEEVRRKRERERLAKLQEEENRLRIERFKEEVSARRLERQEWLKVIEEAEKERNRKLKEQADFIYREAVELYKDREFSKAKEDFLEVETIVPNFKSTTKYLARIDKDIEEEQREKLIERQRLLQREMREDHYAEMKKLEEERAMQALNDERRLMEFKENARVRKEKRDEWDAILAKNEREREQRLKDEAEFIYKEAIAAYKDEDWDRARRTFLEVSEVIPGYKRTERYIERIDRNIKKDQDRIQREIAESNEEQRRKEELARKEEEDRLKGLAQEDNKRQEEYNATQADIAYRFATSLYERQKYSEAKEKFLEAEKYVPGFKGTKRYLARIDADMHRAQDLERRKMELAAKREEREEEIVREKEIKKMLELEEARRIKELKRESKIREEEREEWEKTVQKIEREQQKRLEEQTQSVYEEALRYYEAGWYDQARDAFREVDRTVPGFKSTDKYLARVEKKIIEEERKRLESERKIREEENAQIVSDEEDLRRAEAWRQELVSYKRSRKAQAKRAPISVYGSDIPGFAQDTAVSQAMQKREQMIADQAEIKYREALDAYSRNRFIEAKLKFIEVESTSPGYKATLDYLANIDEKIEGQKENLAYEEYARSLAEQKTYQSTDSMYNERRHNIVDNALIQEEQLYQPSMRTAPAVNDSFKIKKTVRMGEGNWEKKVRDRREELRKQRREVNKDFDKQFKKMYDRAVKLYNSKAYEEAKRMFLQIERMRPGYKRAASYIKKANSKIAKGLARKVHNQVAQTKKSHVRKDVVSDALDAFE